MPTRVEYILPNAAGTPLQLWFNNVNSVRLPFVKWHVGQVRVIVGVLYCCSQAPQPWYLHSHAPTQQLWWKQPHPNAFSESVPRKAQPCLAPDQCAWLGRLQFVFTHSLVLLGGYNPVPWREWIFLIQPQCTSPKGIIANILNVICSMQLTHPHLINQKIWVSEWESFGNWLNEKVLAIGITYWAHSWPNFWQTFVSTFLHSSFSYIMETHFKGRRKWNPCFSIWCQKIRRIHASEEIYEWLLWVFRKKQSILMVWALWKDQGVPLVREERALTTRDWKTISAGSRIRYWHTMLRTLVYNVCYGRYFGIAPVLR